ncbi:MAG TPA: TolC family protein, partial [Myxococcota bacterium]|nr:TolC family protein [Myxococcota bacterium]
MSCSRAPLVAATLSLLTSITAARAQPAAPGRLGVREVAAEVLRVHHALRAAREDIAAARAERRQAGLWPNPEAEAAWSDDLWFAAEGERSGSLGLSQPIPVAGRLARAREVARADVAISQRNSAALALQLVADAEREAVSVLALDRAIGAREEALEATRGLAQISARRFQAAETSEA